MLRPPHRVPRHRHWPNGLLVGLLHVGLAWLIWKPAAWGDRTRPPSPQAPLFVTLLETVPAPSAAPRLQPAARTAPPRRQGQPTAAAGEPQSITWPSGPAPAGNAGPAAGAPNDTAPATAASAAPALNLALPRGASAPWRQHNPALDDPRANTARLTLEQKLAKAMGGDGSWRAERLDLDHIRYRRGNDCIMVTRSRAGQLELANGAFRQAWLVSEC